MTLASLALAVGCSLARAEDAGQRYAKLLADADSYEKYNVLIARQLDSQTGELAVLEAQFNQLDATGADVVGLVARMFEKLEAFVAKDLPFLDPVSDRKERIERLRNLISDEGVSLSEKYRRLLEAYQIELEYGRNLATYAGTMDDGREAEFVRVGRIALLYRTADGTESGYWDRNERKWVVDNDLIDDVLTAERIAKKELAPDVIEVPLPAAQEVGS
jgi:hypothetical protein